MVCLSRIGEPAQINGESCTVTRYWSLIFMQALAGEDEGGQELWTGRSYTQASGSECKDHTGEDNCDIEYRLRVVPSVIDNVKMEGSGSIQPIQEAIYTGTQKPYSKCKDCGHPCQRDSRFNVFTGNKPSAYRTRAMVCDEEDGEEPGNSGPLLGSFHLSMLDASGYSGRPLRHDDTEVSARAKIIDQTGRVTNNAFPQEVYSLAKRKGTVREPVVIVHGGGFNNVSFYGTVCRGTNTWVFEANKK